jgi:hypothetical protein
VLVAPGSVRFRVFTPYNGETSDQEGGVAPYNGETNDKRVLVSLWTHITYDCDHEIEKTNRSEEDLSDLKRIYQI